MIDISSQMSDYANIVTFLLLLCYYYVITGNRKPTLMQEKKLSLHQEPRG